MARIIDRQREAPAQMDGSAVAFCFALYRAAFWLAVRLVLVPYFALRAAFGRDSLALVRMRLGHALPAENGCVVIHGASVGEILASEPLLRELAARDPASRVVLSTTTTHGLEVARQIAARHPSVAACRILPWDARDCIRRWLDASSPRAVIVIETELWPNLFRGCAGRGIPLVMASARIYPRDLPRYELLRPFFASVLSHATLIGARSLDDAVRLRALGADPRALAVLGDMKLAIATAVQDERPSARAGPPVVVAGSTHSGEEELLLEACASAAATFPGLTLVLAPRHVGRAAAVAGIAKRSSLRNVRVVGEIGALRDLYRSADVAFVGGSLVPRGGHNPLEALAAGCPVVTGPHLENVASLTDPFRSTTALTVVPDATALASALVRYLSMSDAETRAMRHAVRERLDAMAPSVITCLAALDRLPSARR